MARFRGKVCDPVAIEIEFLQQGDILDVGRKGRQLRGHKLQMKKDKREERERITKNGGLRHTC